MSTFDLKIPPTPDSVTRDLFESTSDDILENVLLNYVLDIKDKSPELLDDLPVGLQAHCVTFIVDAEVLNGGFNQLMFNQPEIAEMAADAFRHFGMPAAASLAERAWALYERARPRLEAARMAGTIEAFMETYDEPIFEELDRAYMEAEEDFRAARLRYIRSNPMEFFHQRAG